MTPKTYNILGWFLFTVAVAIFLFGVKRYQQSPSGNAQTLMWIVGGSIVLYIVVGSYTFTKLPKISIEDK
jgi:uncharacterized membrane protein YjdF